MKYIDYYAVLGIDKTATDKEIKTAYRKLARQYHPDLHPENAKQQAEEKFKLINEAYEVLSDSDKRAKYDRLGSNWQNGQEFEPPPDMNYHSYAFTADQFDFGFSDFFSSIFGRDFSGGRNYYYSNSSAGRSAQGKDIEAKISLPVKDLLTGTETEVKISSPQVCGSCAGRGFSQQTICRACSGSGFTEEFKKIQIRVPPKTPPGTVLRLQGLGGTGVNGARAGDLYLEVMAEDNSGWKVVGELDLEADLTIYPEQAILGDKLSAYIPGGRVELTINPGTHSGQRLRLKGRGFSRNGITGDIYFKVNIDIRRDISPAEVELYRQIAELNK